MDDVDNIGADRPRIAMLGAFPPQAQGIQEYCGALAEALAQRCTVYALGFKRMYPGFLFPGTKQAMDPTKPPLEAPFLEVSHRLTWHNPLGWLRAAARTPADIFHAQWWSLPLFPVDATFFSVMKTRRKPIVLTVHNVLPHEKDAHYVRATRYLCRRADRVIVHSVPHRGQLEETYGVPAERTLQIPMGCARVDDLPVHEEARRALGLPPGRRYILSIGTIRGYKGIDVLLRAFTAALGQLPDTDLIIAGQPWTDWAPYQALVDAERLGARVHLRLGYVPEREMPYYFAAADLAVLPYTHFDAQSAAAAQVMGYGVPLIVSRLGGLPEWVDHSEAWIAPPRDVEAWADRLVRFFADPETHAAAFARLRERVLAAHAWPAVVSLYMKCYESLR